MQRLASFSFLGVVILLLVFTIRESLGKQSADNGGKAITFAQKASVTDR
jgi:hypothetical protein